jgi:uncharacterized damage-inducible protein DinB
MTNDDIVLLFEYDRWANKRIFDAVAALAPEEFVRELGGGFRSVRDALLHIVASEWGWLTYWKEPSPGAESLPALWDRCDTLFHSDAFPNFAAVQRKWADVEKEQAEFIKQLTEEVLARPIPLHKTHVALGHLMYHLANHSTYHRGQIALMLRQLHAEPPVTDFDEFLVERRGAAAHR